ncbi:hypothetical protein acdb102_13620 [Acidothermaceae bacterium B102]|nr:hypothetical protein acdb102_13620 [Acidothermaceae bacterium B102]
MSLFRRTPAAQVDAVETERWRGRSAEMVDAGALPWQHVLSALKTAPEPGPDNTLDLPALVMAPLGLRWMEVTNRGTAGLGGLGDTVTSTETHIFSGTRYGRPVLMNQGNQRSGQKGAVVCWVSAATPHLSITGQDGRIVAEGSPPLEVSTFLARLSAQPRLWKHVHLVGGAEGVVVKRPITTLMHPQGWIYDLWLAEHLAHLTAYATLPAPDPASTYLPYRLDRAHTW